ncbi:MAG: preprotein translocase subunit SecE [Candidatus Pacebacteria bacterium]|nr:preprotein translocase subunit SecE [Candidatus Paceibacterota bacterium]
MKRFIQYIRDTRGELKHVSWPTTKQTTIFTILVVVISLVVAVLLGFFDFVFTNVLDRLFL